MINVYGRRLNPRFKTLFSMVFISVKFCNFAVFLMLKQRKGGSIRYYLGVQILSDTTWHIPSGHLVLK